MGGLTSAVSTIGRIAPVLSSASTFLTAIPTFAHAVGNLAQDPQAREQKLALQQLQARQQLEMRNLQDQTALQQQQIAAQALADQNQRQAALKRAVARQRAAFGAQGIAPDEGSSGAVLLGLTDQTDQLLADQQRLDSLRSAALDQNISRQSSVNVLQRQQLAQQQHLQRILQES